MIIGAKRIRSRSGCRALADHVWRGAGNKHVAAIVGCEADLGDMVALARAGRHPYAIRHFHISPGEPTTDAEAQDIVSALGIEFGFDTGTVVLVRHEKARRTQYDPMLGQRGYGEHWHLMVPEIDAVTGRVLDSRWMYPRHERLARESELRLLHHLTKGRFNTVVIAALEKNKSYSAAQHLRDAALEDGLPAYAAYTADQRRRIERRRCGPRGKALDLPAVVHQLARVWAAFAPTPVKLSAALRRKGLRLRHPAGPPVEAPDGRLITPPATVSTEWVIDAWDGRMQEAYVLGSAHRLLREPRSRLAEALRDRRPPLKEAATPKHGTEDDRRLITVASADIDTSNDPQIENPDRAIIDKPT